jgi:hypothetical protein
VRTRRENKRLRRLVPRIYRLGDLSQILDKRAYNKANVGGRDVLLDDYTIGKTGPVEVAVHFGRDNRLAAAVLGEECDERGEAVVVDRLDISVGGLAALVGVCRRHKSCSHGRQTCAEATSRGRKGSLASTGKRSHAATKANAIQ